MKAGAIGLYEEALGLSDAGLLLRTACGRVLPLQVERWCGSPDLADEELLRRCARLLAPGGRLLVEAERDDIDERMTAWLEHADGRRGPVFPWARLGVRALVKLAAIAGLYFLEEWDQAGRVFVSVTTPGT